MNHHFCMPYILFHHFIRYIQCYNWHQTISTDIMIEYIQGTIQERTPTYAVLDNHGMGYLINISLNTFQDLRDQSNCKLYIYENIREDAYQLFGFSKLEERNMFLFLIGVNGVGTNTARMILSSLSVAELQACILGEHVDILKMVKGIGLKTAQRIILDLKDKISKNASGEILSDLSSFQGSATKDEAIAALQMLGFSNALSTKAVAQILKETPGMQVEQVIKVALKML